MTAIGDLTANLNVDDQPWNAGLSRATASVKRFGHESASAMTEVGEHTEEAGGSAHGAARAFGFLGRGLGEVGEKFGGANTAAGKTVGTLGGVVSGAGEAVHGLHAMHTALEVAIASQATLNAISPGGWALIAAGAVAATIAYFRFTESAKAAEEAEAEKKKATEEVASEIKNLQREVDKLNKTPLQQFTDELQKAGKSANEVAKLTSEFRQLTIEKERGEARNEKRKVHDAINKELTHKQNEIDEKGMSEGGKYFHEFQANNPQANESQTIVAKYQAIDMDNLAEKEKAQKHLAELDKKADEERIHAIDKVSSLVKSLEKPMDRLIDDAKDLNASFAKGFISRQELLAGQSALQQKAIEETKQKAEKETPTAALEFGTNQSFDEIFKLLHPEADDHAKQTAENTTKMASLLEVIAQQNGTTIKLK